MAKHSHRFVEDFGGFLGYGLDRESNENVVRWYLQKLSDDEVSKVVVRRMSDRELEEIFETLGGILRKHLSDAEYHRLFLKE
ncbi:MAG: hypothetical protein SCH98_00910 [Deferrisomatales bacterium]|nr:hypothetical protein [Deferrisomatales bacterium]